MKFLTILLIVAALVIIVMGRTSGYTRTKTPGDPWKPLDDLVPSLSRFRNVDTKTYTKVINILDKAKKETSDLAISMRYIRDAVDEFSSMSSSLPSGDSEYHDEISELANQLGLIGESVLMDIAEEKGISFIPVFHNDLNH